AVTQDLGDAVATGDVDAVRGAHRGRVDVGDIVQPKGAALGFAGPGIHADEDALVVLQVIKGVVVQERRRHVRRGTAAGPEDLLGPGDVAPGAVEPDGEHGLRVVAAAGVDDSVSR